MDKFYEELVTYFNLPATKAKFTNNNIPAPKQVDVNLGQPDNPQGFEIFHPAIFLSWEENKPVENEPVLLTLNFHVVQEPGTGTENFSNRLSKGLEYIRVLNKIQEILTGFSSSNTSRIRYAGKIPNITPFYRYHILQYRCFIDEILAVTNTDVELDDYNPTFKIKEKQAVPPPTDIDTY